ncbi:ABC transporter permease [Kytococcus sp. Marseille-QA3725]
MGVLTSEMRKIFTTKMWWGMSLAIFVISALFALLIGYFTASTAVTFDTQGNEIPLDDLEVARSVYTGPVTFAYIIALVGGALLVGTEARYRTLTSTFLAVPRRTQVMGAKLLSIAVLGLLFGLAFVLGSIAGGAWPMMAHDFPLFPELDELLKTLGAGVVVVMLWCLLGVGLGILVPNPLWATIIGVTFALIIEPILSQVIMAGAGKFSWLEDVAKFFPSMATSAITDLGQTIGIGLLPWWGGVLVMAAYGLGAALLGMLVTMRRDVI